MMKQPQRHPSQHRALATRTRPPPPPRQLPTSSSSTRSMSAGPTGGGGTSSDPFVFIVDEDLVSLESSKICHPRSMKAFQSSSLPTTETCQCAALLDPIPNLLSSWRSSPNLTHYCRVCNTHLNSCKQSTIHAEGKKHCKRLAYLKFSVESAGQASSDGYQLLVQPPPSNTNNIGLASQQQVQTHNQVSSQQLLQAAPLVHQSTYLSQPPQVGQLQAQICPNPQGSTTSGYGQSSMSIMSHYMTPNYYYPNCFQTTYSQQSPASYQVPFYQEFVTSTSQPTTIPPPPPPPPLQAQAFNTMIPPPAPPIGQAPQSMPPHQGAPPQHYTPPSQGINFVSNQKSATEVYHPIYQVSQEPPQALELSPALPLPLPLHGIQYSTRNVLSSGYGSSSTASTISPQCSTSSKADNTKGGSNPGNSKNSCPDGRKFLFCDSCQMSFPTQSGLESHVKGSRHNRRIKSIRQINDVKKSNHEGGPIRCEVCQVIVNSSHQLQAHIEGQKHRVCCYRRGLHPSTNLLAAATPSSSTPASTAPSECSSSLTASQLKKAANPSLKCHTNPQSNQRSSASLNANSLRKINTSSNGTPNSKNGGSLLGRPRPLQPTLANGAGLMGASPHLATATAAIMTQASILRRNDTNRNGGGLLPLPLPGKLNGLIVTGSTVQYSRPNRSNFPTKCKGRKTNRSNRCQENHDSTTESDEPASNNGSKKKDVPESAQEEAPPSSSSSSPSSSSVSTSTSCTDNSKISNDSSSDEAKESEGDSNEIKQHKVQQSQIQQTSAAKMSFLCEKCDLRVNSAIQLDQHLKSPKHHVKAAAVDASNSNSDSVKMKESPMLNMFLKALHTPSQKKFFKTKEDGGESSATEVER